MAIAPDNPQIINLDGYRIAVAEFVPNQEDPLATSILGESFVGCDLPSRADALVQSLVYAENLLRGLGYFELYIEAFPQPSEAAHEMFGGEDDLADLRTYVLHLQRELVAILKTSNSVSLSEFASDNGVLTRIHSEVTAKQDNLQNMLDLAQSLVSEPTNVIAACFACDSAFMARRTKHADPNYMDLVREIRDTLPDWQSEHHIRHVVHTFIEILNTQLEECGQQLLHLTQGTADITSLLPTQDVLDFAQSQMTDMGDMLVLQAID